MISIAIFPVFIFFPKTEFVSSFAFTLIEICSPFPSDWALLHCLFSLSFWRSVVRLCYWSKSARHVFEATLSPPQRYQNIQDNPEYNSVLSFKIILKNFAVNMLGFKSSFRWWRPSYIKKEKNSLSAFSRYKKILFSKLIFYYFFFYISKPAAVMGAVLW